MMDLTEKTLESAAVYRGLIVNVRRDKALLPDGRPCEREVVEHSGAVALAALTDNGELLFVRQFRYPYGETVLELPAGKLEAGEDPLEAGKRELLEETGASAARYTDLGLYYPSPGYCAEVIHLFAAFGLTFTGASPDEDEFLETERVALTKAVDMVLSGEIRDGKTQTAVLKLAMLLDRERGTPV